MTEKEGMLRHPFALLKELKTKEEKDKLDKEEAFEMAVEFLHYKACIGESAPIHQRATARHCRVIV